MSDNNDQAESPPREGSERKPVIIDLPAQDFGRKADATEGEAFKGARESAAWGAYDGTAGSGEQATSEGLEPRAPGDDQSKPGAVGGTDAAPDVDAGPEQAASGFRTPPVERARGRRGAAFAALLAAALLGGAVAAGGTTLLARQGFLDPAGPDEAPPADLTPELASLRSEVEALRQAQAPAVDVAPLQDQVAQLEAAIAQLRDQSGNASAAAPALQEVQNRLAELERAAASRPAGPADPALEARLTELSGQVEALRGGGSGGADNPLAGLATRIDEIAGQINDTAAVAPRLEEVTGRTDDLARRLEAVEARPPVDLSGLERSLAEVQAQLADISGRLDRAPDEGRVAALEMQLAGIQDKLNQLAGQAQHAQTLGAAVAAGALGDALQSGGPIAAELGALRALGSDPAALDALQPFAEKGLPTIAALRAIFERAAESIDASAPIPEDVGPVDRLLQSARSLVEVRPANPTEGADPGAVVARMRGALEAGDVRAALAERNALPEDAKAQTEEWARAAQARAAAGDLVAQLRAEALSRLGTQG